MEITNDSVVLNSGEEINQTTGIRLWNPKGFLILGVLFSFLPAAILYSLNYGRLGLSRKRNISLAASFIAFVVMISMAIIIEQGIAKSIIYGLNIGAVIFMRNNQSMIFQNHIINGGHKASYLVPVFTSVAISAGLLVLIFHSINIPDQKLMFKGSELYYTERVPGEEAEKLGAYLSEQGFFSEGTKVSVKIDKQSNAYKFSLIIDKSRLGDKELELAVKDMIQELSENVFDGNKLDIILCDNVFKPLKTISR
jgi:hypothetical protein